LKYKYWFACIDKDLLVSACVAITDEIAADVKQVTNDVEADSDEVYTLARNWF
jgi:hypothetical protein